MRDEIVDVDKTWDGKGSLDEHRQREFEKIKHPGFGKAAAKKEAAADPPADIKPTPKKVKTDSND